MSGIVLTLRNPGSFCEGRDVAALPQHLVDLGCMKLFDMESSEVRRPGFYFRKGAVGTPNSTRGLTLCQMLW